MDFIKVPPNWREFIVHYIPPKSRSLSDPYRLNRELEKKLFFFAPADDRPDVRPARLVVNMCRAKALLFTNFRKVGESEGQTSKCYNFVSLHPIDLKFPNYIDYHVLNVCITMLIFCNDVYIVKKVKKPRNCTKSLIIRSNLYIFIKIFLVISPCY